MSYAFSHEYFIPHLNLFKFSSFLTYHVTVDQLPRLSQVSLAPIQSHIRRCWTQDPIRSLQQVSIISWRQLRSSRHVIAHVKSEPRAILQLHQAPASSFPSATKRVHGTGDAPVTTGSRCGQPQRQLDCNDRRALSRVTASHWNALTAEKPAATKAEGMTAGTTGVTRE